MDHSPHKPHQGGAGGAGTPDPSGGDAEVSEIFESYVADNNNLTDEMGHPVPDGSDSQEEGTQGEVFEAAPRPMIYDGFARPAPFSALMSPSGAGEPQRARPVSRTMRTTMNRLRTGSSAGASPVFSPNPSPSPSERAVTPSPSSSQPYSAERMSTTARRLLRRRSTTEYLAESLEAATLQGRNSASLIAGLGEDAAVEEGTGPLHRNIPPRRHTLEELSISPPGPDFGRSGSEPPRSPRSLFFSQHLEVYNGLACPPQPGPGSCETLLEEDAGQEHEHQVAMEAEVFAVDSSFSNSTSSLHDASFSSSAGSYLSAPASTARAATSMDVDELPRSGSSARRRSAAEMRARSLSFGSSPHARPHVYSTSSSSSSASSVASLSPLIRPSFAPFARPPQPSHLSRQQEPPAMQLPSISIFHDKEDLENLTSEGMHPHTHTLTRSLAHTLTRPHTDLFHMRDSGAGPAQVVLSFEPPVNADAFSASSSAATAAWPSCAPPSSVVNYAPLMGHAPSSLPRMRSEGALRDATNVERKHKPAMSRCMSDITADRHDAHQAASESEAMGLDLRGDGLMRCALPVTMQEHHVSSEIRCISPDTLAGLINGQFQDQFDNFVIVDCRYPFEFTGGHLPHAFNFWTMERVLDSFFINPIVDISKGERNAIVFHCEFSAKRGPAQLMFLRDVDRMLNQGRNTLLYPEVYLLEGGFCNIFSSFPHLSSTGGYVVSAGLILRHLFFFFPSSSLLQAHTHALAHPFFSHICSAWTT
jgi:hypothetical protein